MAWKKSLKILLYVAFLLVACTYWNLLRLERLSQTSPAANYYETGRSGGRVGGKQGSLFLLGWSFPSRTLNHDMSKFEEEENEEHDGLSLSNNGSSSSSSCPLIPPGLHGPIKVELETVPSLGEMGRLYPQVMPGGRYKPPNCTSRHRVALIVPYRDREEHLSIFLYNIHHLLLKQQLDYAIFIVEQSGEGPFNRAMLFNVGAAEALKDYDYMCFVFHDVDLIPEDDRNLYNCPLHPRHMSVAINVFMYRLPYTDIFGGVSAMSVEHFKEVNGFSNAYWGWGAEDDDMFNRIRHKKLFISRYPSNVGRYKMLKHAKDAPNPERFKMLFSGVKRISSDGFNNLKYKVLRREHFKLYTWILADLSGRG